MRKLVIHIAILLGALSCTREVPYIPEDTADRLILNAQIDASEGNHKAWVGISKTSTIAKLDDATLVCSVNGKEVSQGAFDEMLSRNAVQSCYLFDALLHPGDVVRLTARGSGLSAYAEVTVPDTTGRLMAVDTLSNGFTMHFTAHVKDNNVQGNYYRIAVKAKTLQSYYDGASWSPWYEQSSERPVNHSNDPILDGRIGGSIGDDFYGIGNNSNHYCVFTDKLFPESDADIRFSVEDHELRKIFADRYYESLKVICYANISLVSMGREEYDYLSIQNVLYDNDYDSSDMLEPVTVPTNVVDGTGFVGVYLPSTISIRLPDIEVGGMVY